MYIDEIISFIKFRFNHLNLLGHIHEAMSLTSNLSGILHIDYVQVIQSRARDNPRVDFNTTWQAYKDGFGNINGNHWLGNLSTYIVTLKKKDFEKKHKIRRRINQNLDPG